MSKDNNDGGDGIDILDLSNETSGEVPKVEKSEQPTYKPDEADLETIDALIKRYPSQNVLDIVKSLQIVEDGKNDNTFFENLLLRMGLIEHDEE